MSPLLGPINQAYSDTDVVKESMTPCIVDLTGSYFGKQYRAVVPFVNMYMYGSMANGEVYQTNSFLATAKYNTDGTAADETYVCNLNSCNGTAESEKC